MHRIINSSIAISMALALSACGGADEGEDAAPLVGATDAETVNDASVQGDAVGTKPAPDTIQPAAASAADIDFGDDSSTWSNDNECDDPRFQGPGMTNTPLLEEDILHDATDCREAFERGELTLR